VNSARGIVLLLCAAALAVVAPLASARVDRPTAPERVTANPIGLTCYTFTQCWGAEALQYRGKNGSRYDYVCPSHGRADFVIWGTDVYTDDSSVCTAAVHTGKISLASGGIVTIEIRPGQSSYQESTRNGITSRKWNAAPGSFVVVAGTPGSPPSAGVGLYGWNANAGNFRAYVGEHFSYICPSGGAIGTVWGTDVYTDDSSVCTAAVHAGKIAPAKGGNVAIEIRPGQASYKGSTRNGVTSFDYGAWQGSFTVGAATGAGTPPTGSATGTVLVNGAPFTGGTIPYGANVDVTNGTLDMSTETGTVTVFGGGGVTSTFKLVRSSASKQTIVEMRLTGGNFSSCGNRALSASEKKKKKIRHLWAKGKGRFRTKGRYSSASVRGTYWLTEDRCDGTFTQVKEGVVAVNDLVKKRTVNVSAGHSYLAKPRK
jgi:hypothetical protein